MKITIKLTEAQVRGLKDYLEKTAPTIDAKRATKSEIQQEIQNIVSGNLQTGAVYDYISKYE